MKKKIVSALILGSLLLPMLAFAQVDTCHIVADLAYLHPDCTPTTDVGYGPGNMPVEKYGQCCLFNSIHVLTRWLSGIIAALVGIFIIVGAMMIITAGGVPEKVTAGRNYILYAVIGMVVFLFARAIPSIARAILGM